MAMLSDYLENKLVDWLFRGQAYTPPAALHFALLTTNTDDDGSPLVEVSGGSYARVSVTRSLTNFAGTQGAGTTAASSGSTGTTSNNAAITFPAPTANWGSVTGVVVYDAATGGNILFYGALSTPKTVNNGDPAPSFSPAEISFQIDN
jgi:hypothetical protein